MPGLLWLTGNKRDCTPLNPLLLGEPTCRSFPPLPTNRNLTIYHAFLRGPSALHRLNVWTLIPATMLGISNGNPALNTHKWFTYMFPLAQTVLRPICLKAPILLAGPTLTQWCQGTGTLSRRTLAHIRLQQSFPLLPRLPSCYVTSAASLTEKGFTSARLKYAAMEVRHSASELQLHMAAVADEACLRRLAQELTPVAEICSSRNRDSTADKSPSYLKELMQWRCHRELHRAPHTHTRVLRF